MNKVVNAKRILIIGDAGRGKSTLANKLSEQYHLPWYSLDDVLWQVKFTVRRDRAESIDLTLELFSRPNWIIEGSTTYLFEPGLDHADLIIHLKFNNLLLQWLAIIKRGYNRPTDSILDVIKFLIYVTRKKYNWGFERVATPDELLKPYKHKVITLTSFKQINKFLNP